MNNFDKIYKDLILNIHKNGEYTDDNVRTKYADGTPATYKRTIGYSFRYDNSSDKAPIITTRFVPIKSAIIELYWIWILQSNDVNVLENLGCKFWNDWKKEDGTIGKAYVYQISKETLGHKSQLHYIIHELKNNPNSRRILTEIWNVDELSEMSLTPCVHLTQWSVLNGKLYLEVRQRSADSCNGIISNVWQYSILHKLVAMECGLKPADIIWNIHDLHFYDRHEKDILEQIEGNTFEAPTVKINNFTSIFDFKPEQIEVLNYKYDKKYKYEIAI